MNTVHKAEPGEQNAPPILPLRFSQADTERSVDPCRKRAVSISFLRKVIPGQRGCDCVGKAILSQHFFPVLLNLRQQFIYLLLHQYQVTLFFFRQFLFKPSKHIIPNFQFYFLIRQAVTVCQHMEAQHLPADAFLKHGCLCMRNAHAEYP